MNTFWKRDNVAGQLTRNVSRPLLYRCFVYVQVWCESIAKAAKFQQVLTDTHSPPPYRVNQALANQPEFAAAFHCDVGTPMNPIERCTVW
ncbi:hypothetical protein ANCDUO_02304 [Ancylostoma duodenale]|uniref:Peptidase M13 C-terminal domain-containing protein n=1 Tax=Ancylostoma duodenale TaxID=51022 RepID=A0A0C2DWV9_9BILA|nr:hypothetical protein ANCDUO_02304 [Ancylostoma duodenale]